jgi:pimeloyl-ACP methyl ester carboxylesterase
VNDAVSSESRTVDIGDTPVMYLEAGSGTSVVSIGDDIQPHLYKSDVILAEQRRLTSFGTCAAMDNCEPAAKRVINALEKLGLDHFDLIGHGAGAMVALNIARLAPGVTSLVLIGPRGESDQSFDDVKCPALTLVGTNDENASLDAGRSITMRPASSHLMYVYDAGSTVGDDRPEIVAYIIRDFMERHNEFLVTRESGKSFP